MDKERNVTLAGPASEQQVVSPATTRVAGRDAFAVAHRHSRIVRALKIVVPAVAIFMAGAFAVASYVMTPPKMSVQAQGSAYADGKLVMANPKLEGVTKENRPYSLSAVRAIQDLSAQDVIELEDIAARLPFESKNWVSVAAPKGTYNRTANTLDVTTPFTIKTTEGMSAKLNSAFVDIARGNLETKNPVDITLNGTRVQADSMKVLNRGKMLVFDKRVRMNIEPSRLQQIRTEGGD